MLFNYLWFWCFLTPLPPAHMCSLTAWWSSVMNHNDVHLCASVHVCFCTFFPAVISYAIKMDLRQHCLKRLVPWSIECEMGMKLFVFGLSQYKRRFYLLMRSLANVQSFNIFSRLDLSLPTAVQICLWLISEVPLSHVLLIIHWCHLVLCKVCFLIIVILEICLLICVPCNPM